MNSLIYNTYVFVFCFLLYYCRELITLHRSRLKRNPDARFFDTWRLLFRNRSVVKQAVKCALFSMGIFLGIEIAKIPLKEKSKNADTQHGENRVQ
ncbi:MAG: hypothetical protein DRR06_08560 [Gammaproteobacteria bacterium]|nr:MAG: hypothetical protein DRR06_08560 [Gammaproteobacteria bacterium]RLA50607.1 MAG: hypothetical protein DRR42_12640 [Gammaproteobacteria bacterium]